MESHTNCKLTIDGSIVLIPAPAQETTPEPDMLTNVDGELMYRINRYDDMPAFLMSLVSDSDLWLYVSSYGALTAGRIDEEHCLFPYVTDDQLHRAAGTTGPVTTLRIRRPGTAVHLWEPFARFPSPHGIERNCYKSLHSNRIVFEEINHGLGLTFRYSWAPSDRFGFVRSVAIENHVGSEPAAVDLIDGVINVLPAGVGLLVQQRYGCLIDAYTRCEIDAETGIGIFALASQMIDRAEPAESLTAAVIWARGLPNPTYMLSTDQVPAFVAGQEPQPQHLLTGRRGAYTIAATLSLQPGESATWDIVADVNQDQAHVEALRSFLLTESDPRTVLHASVAASRDALAKIVAAADGQESSGDQLAAAHLASCVLFNVMRGGVFAKNYDVPTSDFRSFIAQRNHHVGREHAAFLNSLPGTIAYGDLIKAAEKQHGSPDLLRLTHEYLPLTFSRRHGDPSRPWNRFAIKVKNPDGSQILSYQGNWRDIFQNWESLCLSYPGFLESIIGKFVNASTVDGFNPYRVMREGIEWESPDPEDPWATIGYWGDHQIIYLLKFLEASQKYHPGLLDRYLSEAHFSYANVPYRIKAYKEILRDVRNTIVFDHALDIRIAERVRALGADGKLVPAKDGSVYHVTLTEKLLVAALSKLSNLVVDGGIWMNTQRPEWNDANNALVGNGISMVTLCYLRRYLAFCRDLFGRQSGTNVTLSVEVANWMDRVSTILSQNVALLEKPQVGDLDRRRLLDALGAAFSDYREHVYNNGFAGMATRSLDTCRSLCDVALGYLDHSVRANKREDGLYHAYNLLDLENGNGARIRRLYEMLEGQVAVLSASLLSPEESGSLVKALFKSNIYRSDQNTFLLYPARELPHFLRKNIVPADRVHASPLLQALVDAGDVSIIVRDIAGHYRFNARFRNATDLGAALDRLDGSHPALRDLIAAHRQDTLSIYELVFDHHAFTGRSGAMYGYEGLGCIYWHMVSKLLVGVQESYLRAVEHGASAESVKTLAVEYYHVRSGMGFNKSAHLYGAFPADPYSHTPAHSGARQPGMTGQSKEDILARWGELGISVVNGALAFKPSLLRRREYVDAARTWEYFDGDGRLQSIELPEKSLAFTVCTTPVAYCLTAGDERIVVRRADGSELSLSGNSIDAGVSSDVFARNGSISSIEVHVPRSIVTLD